jgi:hypothetical protein
VRQLLCDSVLVSVAGGALGVLLAFWAARIIPALFFERDAERLVFSPDLRGIILMSGACAGVTIVCGLAPLFDVRHGDPAAVLQRESGGPSKAMRRVRDGLVVMQMTCCCLLIVSTGLLFEGFRAALRTSAGSRLGQPILATLQSPFGFRRPDLGLEYFRKAERAAQSLPGISATAWAATLPGSTPVWSVVRIEPPGLASRDIVLDVAEFTARSLSLITLPPIAGRMFGGSDTAQTCRVVIANEEAAEELFHGDAVGRSIEDEAGQRVEIVGVVAMRRTPTSVARRPAIFYYAEQGPPPLNRIGESRFRVPILPSPATGTLAANVVSASYFDAMGLAVIAGRVFGDDPEPGACRVGVINQEAADLYFGGRAVGGAIVDAAGRRTAIVGVVRPSLLGTLQRYDEPAIYFPLIQDFLPRLTLMLGAHDANNELLAAVRQRLDAVAAGTSGTVVVTTLQTHLSRTAVASERIATTLIAVSAATALTLAIVGLHGAMGDAARQRRREIAVRIALGARGWHVTRQLLANGARLAAAGAVAGLMGSILVARWLAGIAPRAGSLSPWMWLAAPVLLLTAVAIAGVLPVRRALTVNLLTIMHDK